MKKKLTGVVVSLLLLLSSLVVSVQPASAAWYYAGVRNGFSTWCWESSSTNCYQEKYGPWYLGPTYSGQEYRYVYRRTGSIPAYPNPNFAASSSWKYHSTQWRYIQI